MKYISALFVLLSLNCAASEMPLSLTRSKWSLPHNWPKNEIPVPGSNSSEQSLRNFQKALSLFAAKESAVLTVRNKTKWDIGLSLTTRYKKNEVGDFLMIKPHGTQNIPIKNSPQERSLSLCYNGYEKNLPITMDNKTIFIFEAKPTSNSCDTEETWGKASFDVTEINDFEPVKKPTYRRRSIG